MASEQDVAVGAAAGTRPRSAGLALCLSGGGYRAALFHLGAVRRLNELGILSKVATISSVSGGSILSAHLTQTIPSWPQPGEILPSWDERVAQPFKEFVRRPSSNGHCHGTGPASGAPSTRWPPPTSST